MRAKRSRSGIHVLFKGTESLSHSFHFFVIFVQNLSWLVFLKIFLAQFFQNHRFHKKRVGINIPQKLEAQQFAYKAKKLAYALQSEILKNLCNTTYNRLYQAQKRGANILLSLALFVCFVGLSILRVQKFCLDLKTLLMGL